MAGKARVHELAKELGVESKVVLAKLKEMGEFVKSASSTVEAPVARRLRGALEASNGSAPAPAAAPATSTRGCLGYETRRGPWVNGRAQGKTSALPRRRA